MRAIAFAAAVCLCGPALGETLPGLFDVRGVSSGSALIVRSEPRTGAEAIGRLAADAQGIEVVARDASGRWGSVNFGEGSGWVALRYLAERPGVWDEGAPEGLRCFGTEPFWSAEPRDGALVLTAPDAEDRAMPLRHVLGRGAPGDPRRGLVAGTDAARATLVFTAAACSDGMSDRRFGLDASLVLEEGAEAALMIGCCSIAP